MVNRVTHEFGPFYQKDSKILILGSFPSIKSRESGFYYMHPQNRFWIILSRVFNVPFPKSLQEKKQLLKDHQIALWDVIESCTIENSNDASIQNVIATDLKGLFQKTNIETVITTGKKAHQLYQKYSKPMTGMEDINLPSTSSANIANYNLDQLVELYQIIKEKL